MNNNKYFETIRVSDGCGRYHDEKQPRHICETCKYGPEECAKTDTICYSGKINWRCWEPKFDNEDLYETVTNWSEGCGGHFYKEKQLKHICKTCAEGPIKCCLFIPNHKCWIDPFSEYNMKKPHVVDLEAAEEETEKDLIKYGLIDCLDQEISNIEEPLESVPTEPLVFEKSEPQKEDEAKTKWRFDKMVDVDANTTDEELAKKIVDSVLEHIEDKNRYYMKSRIDRIASIDEQLEELIDKTNALQEEKQALIDTLNPLEFLYMKYELAKNYVLDRVDYAMLVKIYKALDVKVTAKEPEKALRKEIEEAFDDLLEDTLRSDKYKSVIERQFENGTKCNLFIVLKIKIISKEENASLFTSIQNKSFNVECTLSVRPISTGIVK